uniref:Uncharacterized protein n=1 Tax=Arundo donax TaxID=35708 RepID=A0A0A9GXG6_ARUDO
MLFGGSGGFGLAISFFIAAADDGVAWPPSRGGGAQLGLRPAVCAGGVCLPGDRSMPKILMHSSGTAGCTAKADLMALRASGVSVMAATEPSSRTPLLHGRKTTVRRPADRARDARTYHSGAAASGWGSTVAQAWRPEASARPGPPAPSGNEKYMDARKYISAPVTRSSRSA